MERDEELLAVPASELKIGDCIYARERWCKINFVHLSKPGKYGKPKMFIITDCKEEAFSVDEKVKLLGKKKN
jgi:hypothetical protein